MMRKYCGRVFVSVSNPDSKSYILITRVTANVSVCHSYPMKFGHLNCCDANKNSNRVPGEDRMHLLLEAYYHCSLTGVNLEQSDGFVIETR